MTRGHPQTVRWPPRGVRCHPRMIRCSPRELRSFHRASRGHPRTLRSLARMTRSLPRMTRSLARTIRSHPQTAFLASQGGFGPEVRISDVFLRFHGISPLIPRNQATKAREASFVKRQLRCSYRASRDSCFRGLSHRWLLVTRYWLTLPCSLFPLPFFSFPFPLLSALSALCGSIFSSFVLRDS